MADTVNLFGSQVKKGYVIAGGGVVVVAVFYGYYRNKKASAAAATSATDTSQSATDTSSGIDPATGYPTGSAADTAALDQLSGVPGGAFGGGYGGYGYSGGFSTNVTGTQYATNGEWAQAAEQYLTSTVGADPTAVAAALGKYITGQTVTDANMISVIEEAIAFAGYPPVPGPHGFPPNINPGGPPPPPPPPGPPPPGPPPPPGKLPAPSGLHVISVTRSEIHVGWNPVTGQGGGTGHPATPNYQIQVSPKDRAGHGIGNRTNYVAGGLKSRTRYTIHVSSQAGGPSAAISETTK